MANQFFGGSTNVTTSAATVITFPWVPDHMTFLSRTVGTLYLSLSSGTVAASSAGYQLRSSESLSIPGRTRYVTALAASSGSELAVTGWQWTLAAVSLWPLFAGSGMLG